MNDFRGSDPGFRRLVLLALSSGTPRVQPQEINSVREDETALCLDCRVTFSIRNRACPKCDGDSFWLIANWKKRAPEPRPAPTLIPPSRVVMA